MSKFLFDATEGEAAAALGLKKNTVQKWRLDGKIPEFCFTKFGYKTVRYCVDLLIDRQQNHDDFDAQNRSAAALNASLISNAPKRRGRKSE